jgi:hypothetical protein
VPVTAEMQMDSSCSFGLSQGGRQTSNQPFVEYSSGERLCRLVLKGLQ